MGTSSATPQYQGPSIDPSVPFEIRLHLTQIYQKLGNHNQAFSLQQQQIAAIKTATKTIVEGGGGGSTPVTPAPTGISVNNQSGVTSYTTALGDNNSLILFSDASPIAVTLATQSPPWSTYIANIGALGAGTITLTPFTGTINGGATLTILPTYFAIVAFDGTNWWAATLPIVPVNTPVITHEWLNAYNASTGIFTQTQPAAADLSDGTTGTGAVVLADNPTFITDINAPIVYGGNAAGSTLTLDGTSNGSPSNAYVLLNPSAQGNIGIWNSSPTYPLVVTGNIGTGFSQGVVEIQANSNVAMFRMNNLGTGGKVWGIGATGNTSGIGQGNFGIFDCSNSVTALAIRSKPTPRLGVGINNPNSPLAVSGLPVYANNAAAIAGGLAVGDFYRTGADPDPVCVVH